MTDVKTHPDATAPDARAVSSCRVCGAQDWREVISLGHLPLADSFLEPSEQSADEPRYPLEVISCRKCQLMSLTHVVNPEILYRSYPYETSESRTIADHMDFVASYLCQRFSIARGGLVVEIGSNTGAQLQRFRDRDQRTIGVDPARNIAETANKRGIETLSEFFGEDTANRILEEHGRADLIIGRHVLAHIDAVGDVCRGARRLLRDSGVLAVEVPYAVDMLEKVEFDTIYHEHLSYFTIKALTTLFARNGMRIVEVEELTVHGGSILVVAARDDSAHAESPTVARMLGREHRLELATDLPYVQFRHQVERNQRDLVALTRQLVGLGHNVAGYGAPAKGNTLLGSCGIGRDMVPFCLDTTPSKQGKLLPGTHIPVHSPREASEHQIDYYLLLAWNYQDEIVAKEADFVASGGRFIVPHPRPNIIPAP